MLTSNGYRNNNINSHYNKHGSMNVKPVYFCILLVIFVCITLVYKGQVIITIAESTKYSEFDSCILDNPFLANKLEDVRLIDLNPNGHECKIKLNDQQIINLCQNNTSIHTVRTINWPEFQNVPPLPPGAEHEELQLKYQRRVSEGGCSFPKGMWGKPFNSRCTIVTMADIGHYKPNDLMLDWGSGCGHQATWMTRYVFKCQ